MMKQNLAKKQLDTTKDSDFNTEKFLSDTLHHDVYIEKNSDNQLVYKVEIIVGDFKPNEIKLKLKGKKLIIHALKQVNKIKYELRGSDAQHNYDIRNYLNDNKTPKISNLREHEEFKREIQLPNFVLPETIVSFLETYEDRSENTLLLEGQIDSTKLEIENNNNNNNNNQNESFKYKVIPSPIYNNDKNIITNKTCVTTTNNTNTDNNSKKNSNHNTKNENGNHTNGRNGRKKTSSSDESSIDQIEESQMANYSNGCLKYKFDLRQYDSHDINISIKNKEILVVSATNENNKFSKEIKLPKNSEIHNIRNCFDEASGLLRIEIPLKTQDSDSADAEVNSINNNRKSKSNSDDKYLELVFDLHDYKFDQIDVQKNDENKNILIVRALRLNPSILNDCINNKSTVADTINKNSFVRKYILPDWVSTKNIKVHEEKKLINGEKKNLLILHIPFL